MTRQSSSPPTARRSAACLATASGLWRWWSIWGVRRCNRNRSWVAPLSCLPMAFSSRAPISWRSAPDLERPPLRRCADLHPAQPGWQAAGAIPPDQGLPRFGRRRVTISRQHAHGGEGSGAGVALRLAGTNPRAVPRFHPACRPGKDGSCCKLTCVRGAVRCRRSVPCGTCSGIRCLPAAGTAREAWRPSRRRRLCPSGGSRCLL